MRLTSKNHNGTSFHGTVIFTSVKELKRILGKPTWGTNDGRDKVNYEWVLETDDGSVFTIYDWKEYRKLKQDETIEWHVGGKNGRDTDQGKKEILEALAK